ncbi:hypothetical protein ACH5RR_030638 [Cinchona calisaya]|uniref:Uncharacterized protein n=1 Tax=Cinchona calisaya TaxID=153742 RepID=A0ABD2YYE4_9GENT
MLGYPKSLRNDYPTLKPRLLHLAWLEEQQKFHETRVAECDERMAANPSPSPDQVPFILEERKNHSHMATYFKNEVRKMSSGELYREMRKVEDGNPVGILCHEINDVKCIYVLRKFGPYTKMVLYRTDDPQTEAAAIVTASEELKVPCKALNTAKCTEKQIHEAIDTDEDISREKRHVSPDRWNAKKSS